ncbi:heterokaryon incompatibility protein-domain-containing protein [Xylariaceae sp. FL1651]|nr:heterokaryon incompatibility protein-domain-containing protein [Xylariaceae sp. FL1651]
MRLLNAETLVISEWFVDTPPYAILSHTWGDEEVSFSDMSEGSHESRDGKKYRKLLRCCKQVISDGLEYVWIDTCCIDKRSSAELSEAINSMFSWYQQAIICYAYLEDVDSGEEAQALEWTTGNRYPSNFNKSRWFTRGWTLQELIAPPLVVFYTSDWVEIGTRDELKDPIAEATRISRDFFINRDLSRFSIAQKMSWSSRRMTTRVEDQAYCLLGLFGVSMPLLYGEGRKAFARLQEEIMKTSDDQSIFAWATETGYRINNGNDDYEMGSSIGILAPSPAVFAHSNFVVQCFSDQGDLPYQITNKGIQIALPILSMDLGYQIPFVPYEGEQYLGGSGIKFTLSVAGSVAVLNCCFSSDPRSRIAILVQQTNSNKPYYRTNYNIGLISIPLDDINNSSVRKQLFFQAQTELNEILPWSRMQTRKLVIIQPFSVPLSDFKLKRTIPDIKYQIRTTGAISMFLHDFMPVEFMPVYTYDQVSVLLFQHRDGAAFLLAFEYVDGEKGKLRSTVICNFEEAVSDEQILNQARVAINDLPRTDSAYQRTPTGGLLRLRLVVKEAAHALFFNLDVSRGLLSNLEERIVHEKPNVVVIENGVED